MTCDRTTQQSPFEDFPDLDLEAVKNGRMMLIELCISAYGDGLTDADN